MKMKHTLRHAAIPIIATSAGLVLLLLALTASRQPGSIEDYSIVSFNTSELARKVSGPSFDGGKPISTGNVGLHQFYRIHVLAICEGDLAPNTTATFQVTSCSRVTKTAQFNVTALLDQDVRNDSSELSLASLGFTEDLVHVLNQIPAAFMAVSALFMTGSVLVGASLAGSVCAVFAVQRARAAVLANLILAWLAWLVLLLATAISQATASTITRKVNELDDDVGLSAASGTKFSALTWAAVSLALVAALSWSWTFAQHPKQLDDPSFDFAGRMRLPSRSMSTMNGLGGKDELVETTLLGRRRTLTFTMVQPPPAYLTGASEKDRV